MVGIKSHVPIDVLGRNPTPEDFLSFPGVSDRKPGLIGDQASCRQDSLWTKDKAWRFLAPGSASAPN